MRNILWFKLLKKEVVLFFSVLDCKLNVIWEIVTQFFDIS